MRQLVGALILSLGLLASLPAFSQSAAEDSPEAVYVSQTHGVPQLNGRLILPGRFLRTPLEDQIAPLQTAWSQYLTSFLLNPQSRRDMLRFGLRDRDRLQRILSERAGLSPAEVETFMISPSEMSLQRLNEFEVRDLLQALRETYMAERHVPVSRVLPVTILMPGSISSYDLAADTMSVYVSNWDTIGMSDGWENVRLPSGLSLRRWAGQVPVSETVGRQVLEQAEESRFGRNAVFIGVETYMHTAQQSTELRIHRISLSLNPTLSAPFAVFDLDAERETARAEEARRQAEEQATEAARREALASAVGGGFNRDATAQRFETLGLVIGQRAPEDVAFTAYDWAHYEHIPSRNRFFHAEVPGGQAAYLTANGEPDGPIVYFSRSFDLEVISRDNLRQMVLQRLGPPSLPGSSSEGIWWDASLPADRHRACRLDLHSTGLGNAALHGQGWTRNPMHVDVNQFQQNCGVVASMSFFSGSYAVADTTWWNIALRQAIADQQAAEAEQQREAMSEIEF